MDGSADEAPSPPPLRRGRPRKEPLPEPEIEAPRPKRGRPREEPLPQPEIEAPRPKRGRPRKVEEPEPEPEPAPLKPKRKREPRNPAPKDISFESKRGPVQFTALKRYQTPVEEAQAPAAPVNARRAHLERLFYS